ATGPGQCDGDITVQEVGQRDKVQIDVVAGDCRFEAVRGLRNIPASRKNSGPIWIASGDHYHFVVPDVFEPLHIELGDETAAQERNAYRIHGRPSLSLYPYKVETQDIPGLARIQHTTSAWALSYRLSADSLC